MSLYLEHARKFTSSPQVPRFILTSKILGCNKGCKSRNSLIYTLVCGERGIRTPGTSQCGGFQDRCNRPLYHLSNLSYDRLVGRRETCSPEKRCKGIFFFLYSQVFIILFFPKRLFFVFSHKIYSYHFVNERFIW